nr:unnamed protein product [Digitaria exilis]
MARCACGAIPDAVPCAFPRTSAFWTKLPAAVLAVCVPCPASSTGGAVSLMAALPNARAPITLLLQPPRPPAMDRNWQVPFHFLGGGGRPASPKEGWLGRMPVSRRPITTPRPNPERLQKPSLPRWRPRKPGDGRNSSGYRRRHPSLLLRLSASASVSRAANPFSTWVYECMILGPPSPAESSVASGRNERCHSSTEPFLRSCAEETASSAARDERRKRKARWRLVWVLIRREGRSGGGRH